MLCKNCGKEIPINSEFYAYCGAPTVSLDANRQLTKDAIPKPRVTKTVSNSAHRGTKHIWFYELKGLVYGPTSADDVYGRILDGRLPPNVSIWKKSSSDWAPASDYVLFGKEEPDAADVMEQDSMLEADALPPMVSLDGKTAFTYHIDHDDVMPAITATGKTVKTGQPSLEVNDDGGLDHGREDDWKRSWFDPLIVMIMGLLAGAYVAVIMEAIAGQETNLIFEFTFIVMTPGITFLAAWILALPWLLIGRRTNRSSVVLTQMRIWVPLGVALLVIAGIGGLSTQNHLANGIGAILFIVLGWVDRTVKPRRERNEREGGLWIIYALQYWLLN